MATNQQHNVLAMDPANIPWIHCNSCYKLYEKSNNFYILSCCNVMCRNCFKKGGRTPFCTICKKFVSFKIIKEEMEPKYSRLFKPEISYDSHVEEFQYKQAMNLAKKIAKTEKILEENKSYMKKLVEYNERYKKLRALRKQKQKQLKSVYTRQTKIKTSEKRRTSEFGSSNDRTSRSVLSPSSSLFSTSIIPKSTSSSIKTESSKQFFQNHCSSSLGNKAPYRKKYDLSTTTKFNTHFKPPTKSTPIS